MPDTKLTALTEDTAPALTDITYQVKDPGGVPASYKMTWQTVWNLLTSLTAKTSLADADQLSMADSAASNVAKKITWANIRAALLTYFNTRDGWIAKSETWTARTQAYTNDPAAGNDITLNMANTSGAQVGGVVKVSSSAGSENAIITTIVANTSITVKTLALNHTTTSPLVTFLGVFTITGDYTADVDYQIGMKIKCTNNSTTVYGVICANVVVTGVTYITLASNNDYSITNAAITLPYISKIAKPDGFPRTFSFTPRLDGTTAGGVGTYTTQLGKFIPLSMGTFVSIDLTWTAHTGTGNMRLDGLPVVVANDGILTPLSVLFSNLTLAAVGNKVQCQFINNAPQIQITEIGSGGNANLGMDAAGTLRVAGWYTG